MLKMIERGKEDGRRKEMRDLIKTTEGMKLT